MFVLVSLVACFACCSAPAGYLVDVVEFGGGCDQAVTNCDFGLWRLV